LTAIYTMDNISQKILNRLIQMSEYSFE
jgi:hypothetical protein